MIRHDLIKTFESLKECKVITIFINSKEIQIVRNNPWYGQHNRVQYYQSNEKNYRIQVSEYDFIMNDKYSELHSKLEVIIEKELLNE